MLSARAIGLGSATSCFDASDGSCRARTASGPTSRPFTSVSGPTRLAAGVATTVVAALSAGCTYPFRKTLRPPTASPTRASMVARLAADPAVSARPRNSAGTVRVCPSLAVAIVALSASRCVGSPGPTSALGLRPTTRRTVATRRSHPGCLGTYPCRPPTPGASTFPTAATGGTRATGRVVAASVASPATPSGSRPSTTRTTPSHASSRPVTPSTRRTR